MPSGNKTDELIEHFVIPSSIYDKYKNMHSGFFKAACKATFEQGEHVPMFIIKTGKKLHFLPAPFSDNHEKMMYINACKLIAHATNADAVFFICESWASTEVKDSEIEVSVDKQTIIPQVMPKDDPNRMEVLFCNLWIRNIGGKLLAGEMIRDSNDTLVKIEVDKTIPESNSSAGLFTNLCGEDIPNDTKDKTPPLDDILRMAGKLRGETGINTAGYKKHYKKVIH